MLAENSHFGGNFCFALCLSKAYTVEAFINGTPHRPCISGLQFILYGFFAEVPHSANSGVNSFPFQQGKGLLPLAYTNGCGVPQASVRQQPLAPGKQRIGSTTSVCSNSSKKSCKSTASQIQEVAGDGKCMLGDGTPQDWEGVEQEVVVR